VADGADVLRRVRDVPDSMRCVRHCGTERGAVMVLAGVALFPIIFLAAFAIDVSHWWDYSRNLQNRADAAALAGAAQYGNTCFAGGTPGTTANGYQSVIGKWAQLYSGAGVNEPLGNLPYTDAAVSAATNIAAGSGTGPGTGWNLSTNGYINNTLNGSPVNSPLTLRLGSLANYWMILNGTDYAENGGTNFSLKTGGGATFCNSDPTLDLTDPDRANAGAAGPFVDVKVSQRNLPLFFPLVSGRPTLHAHARVSLEGESSSPSEPIAVGDNGFTPCVSVNVVDASNTVLQTVPLTRITPLNSPGPVQWDNSALPYNFTMPGSGNVYLQPFLNNCNGSGTTYDGDSQTGLLMINNAPADPPTNVAGNAPQLTPGGVTVSGGPCPGGTTQYFSNGACPVTITAFVKFDPAVAQNKTSVFAWRRFWDPVAGAYTQQLIGNSQGMTQDGTDPTKWTEGFSLPDTDGMDQIIIKWEQDAGSINNGTTACTNASPCTGTFGVQQQVFAACNGCDQPDDSGPVVFMRVSDNGTNDSNSLAGGSGGHNLVFTLKLAGLAAATFPSPATVLRFPTSGNHQTGLIDCGQGAGTNGDSYVVYYGCGPQNPMFSPPLNSLFVNTRNTCGTPPGPPWPVAGQQDCVLTTPGTRRQGIICPLVLRVVGAPLTNNCNSNSVGTCPENLWTKNSGNIDVAGDPRALTFIITSVADFGSVAGSPQGWVPIRRFATFYITGWDSAVKPQCPSSGQFVGNEAFPLAGKQNSQNAAVWGHWINYSDSAGTGNNQPCDLSSVTPTNCVPVLTR
jgi:Putative Flp pilus-assembly TadE/G-like